MEPLEVFFLDENFDRLTGSIPYTVLTWTRRYYEPGEFMMEIPIKQYIPEAKYVYADDRPETGIIQKVEVVDSDYNADDSIGIDVVKISGFFLEAWLNDFVYLVEEKITEKYYEEIPYPVFEGFKGYNTTATAPEIAVDDEGNTYIVRISSTATKDEDGWTRASSVKSYYDAKTREWVGSEVYRGYNEGTTNGNVPNVVSTTEVTPGYGMRGVWANIGNQTTGHTDLNQFRQNYCVDYYAEDGKNKIDIYLNVTQEDVLERHKRTYDVVYQDKVGGQGGGVSIYVDENGNYRYVTGSVRHISNEYRRAMEEWEENATREGVVRHIVSDDGLTVDSAGLWYEKYRTVAGPYVIRDTFDLIGVEKDNAQAVMDYAQRTFGNNILYDTVPITGVRKVVDPSLQRFGDFCFEELKTIEASIQLTYSFRNNTFVLSIWRGVDRTQSQTEYPWAVFSDTWGTLYGYSASIDESNYRNKCYTMYDYDEPTAWVDAELASRSNGQLFEGQPMYRPITEKKFDSVYDVEDSFIGFKIPYKRKQSFEIVRLDDNKPFEKETFLDLRDEKPEPDNYWSRNNVLATEASTLGAVLDEEGNIDTLEVLSAQGWGGSPDDPEQLEKWNTFIEGYDYEVKTSTEGSFDNREGRVTYRYFAPRLTEDAQGMKDVYAAYRDGLRERGFKHLTDNYGVVTNLDTGILVKDGYMSQWNLGDKVDMAISTLGTYAETRITEVVETHVSGESKVEITLGDKLITQTERAKLI